MAEFSPMMQQYLAIKQEHPNEILFYRIGDFYEMFFDDALTVSRELDLTLTGKQCGMEERAPMCGVPFHAYESYMARLLAKGYKVAICEQMEDPSAAKGLVRREIIRVVTPGTVIESSMLPEDRNNFIASLYYKKGRGGTAGLAFADVSTGEVHGTDLSGKDLEALITGELARFSPAEILLGEDCLELKGVTGFIKNRMRASVELLPSDVFQAKEAEKALAAQFGAAWRQEGGYAEASRVPQAVAALLGYLERTQKHGLERIKAVSLYREAQFMQLSPVTRANLELTETMRTREKRGSLLWVLDKTVTAMGRRLLRTWVEQPLVEASRINDRQEAVAALVADTVRRGELGEALGGMADLGRLATRAVYGSASPHDVLSLASSFRLLPAIAAHARGTTSALLTALADGIDPLADLAETIEAAVDPEAPALLKEGRVIRAGYDAEVDELRGIMHGSTDVLQEMEARLREETGIPKLRVSYTRAFGYYIEVSRSFTDKVPPTFVRRQTLTTGERYITPELKELENKILGAGERLAALERKLFSALLARIGAEAQRISATADAVAALDVLGSLARVAVENGYARPTVDETDVVEIEAGRHPVVERMLAGAMFVPNDVALGGENARLLIVTGPNMAGKSTYMRQTALLAVMAQIGSFVPAKSAHIGIVDAVFTRIGAADDLAAGQSTFMVEMTEVAEILRRATRRSLVVLDEIGRGTSTYDGMSIARAVVEHIADPAGRLGCKTLFATHYHELTELEGQLEGVRNVSVAVKKRGDEITFLRRIVPGPADDSYGIEVAKLAGLPGSVTRRAQAVLKRLEAEAPDLHRVMQLSFEEAPALQAESLPGELVERLRAADLDTFTPIEALGLLYELQKMLNG